MRLTICHAIATGTLCRQAAVVCQIKLYDTKEKVSQYDLNLVVNLHDWTAN